MTLFDAAQRPRKAMAADQRACPICASTQVAVLHTQRYGLFDDSALPRETTIVRCDTCGMVYARSDACAEAYRAHYTQHSKYDTSVAASGSGESPFDRRRLRDTAKFLGESWSRGGSFLDVGAGRGGLLAALRSEGFSRLAGVDPAAGCVHAMRTQGFPAAQGTIEDVTWDLTVERFDGVVLSHVLEHLYDVDDSFARVAARVAPGGEIYLEVPDASRYTIDGFPAFYFFDPEHINHFEPAAIVELGRRHDWFVARWWPRWIELDTNQRYPALGALLRRANTAAHAPHGASVEAYVLSSRTMLDASSSVRAVQEFVRSQLPIVIWGAGSHAQRLLSQTGLGASNILCIIDNDPGKQGRSLDGHRIVGRDEGVDRAKSEGATVVVAIAVDPASVIDYVRTHAPELQVLAP